jgi:hypothetical protein
VTLARQESAIADLVSFRWHRLEEPGWRTLHHGAEQHGRVAVPAGDSVALVGVEGESYVPLKDEPALFRIFAGIEDTPEAFADFARAYGSLDPLPDRISRTARSLPEGYAGDEEDWGEARENMALAIELWDELRDGSPSDLLARRWETKRVGDEVGVYPKGPPQYWEGELMDSCLLIVAADSSDREIVQAMLRSEVNQGLKFADVTPALAPTNKSYGAGLRLTYRVGSLLGAMWLQLALAIDGNRDYRTCGGCGLPWDATGARASRDWCSERCRQRIYRRSQKQPTAGGSGTTS